MTRLHCWWASSRYFFRNNLTLLQRPTPLFLDETVDGRSIVSQPPNLHCLCCFSPIVIQRGKGCSTSLTTGVQRDVSGGNAGVSLTMTGLNPRMRCDPGWCVEQALPGGTYVLSLSEIPVWREKHFLMNQSPCRKGISRSSLPCRVFLNSSLLFAFDTRRHPPRG